MKVLECMVGGAVIFTLLFSPFLPTQAQASGSTSVGIMITSPTPSSVVGSSSSAFSITNNSLSITNTGSVTESVYGGYASGTATMQYVSSSPIKANQLETTVSSITASNVVMSVYGSPIGSLLTNQQSTIQVNFTFGPGTPNGSYAIPLLFTAQ